MRELGLFSGCGLGALATQWLLGWESVGYVEWDNAFRRRLAARMRDGLLDTAPLWRDIRDFVTLLETPLEDVEADVVTAGFPCQPFSQAGARKGVQDDRNQWPATARVLRVVRPLAALLENVPGLLVDRPIWRRPESWGTFDRVDLRLPPYAGRVFGDLDEIGYDAWWDCLPASAVGAPHQRDRLWILAVRCDVSDAGGGRLRQLWERSGEQHAKRRKALAALYGEAELLAYSEHQGVERHDPGGLHAAEDASGWSGEDAARRDVGAGRAQEIVADADGGRLEGGGLEEHRDLEGEPRSLAHGCGARGWRNGKEEMGDAEGDPERPRLCERESAALWWGRSGHAGREGGWWEVDPADVPESPLGRVAHGSPDLVDELRGLGEGWVPAVAALAWNHLMTRWLGDVA